MRCWFCPKSYCAAVFGLKLAVLITLVDVTVPFIVSVRLLPFKSVGMFHIPLMYVVPDGAFIVTLLSPAGI